MTETTTNVAAPVTKTVKSKASQKSATPTTNGQDKERAAAKKAGVTLVQFRILKAISDGKPHSYRRIEKKTGYYSILTAQLRKSHEGSLGALGLVKEKELPVEGRPGGTELNFTITPKGLKALGK